MRGARLMCLALFLGGATPLPAQAVLQPEVKLDSTRTRVRNAVYRLRDSLQLAGAASARLGRDMSRSSDALMFARARLIAGRCKATAEATGPTRGELLSASLPNPDPNGALQALLRALDTLEVDMKQCETSFEALATPAKVEELRGYGVGRATRVQAAMRRFEDTARDYFRRALGIRYLASARGAGSMAPSR
jgi:hypothetical protein